MNVSGIDATYYVVADIERTTAFYSDLLGAPPDTRVGDRVSEWVLPDGASFGLYRTDDPEAGHNGSVMFAVADVAAAVEKARGGGVRFHGDGEVTDTPVCHMAFGEDNEGNQFILHKRKAG